MRELLQIFVTTHVFIEVLNDEPTALYEHLVGIILNSVLEDEEPIIVGTHLHFFLTSYKEMDSLYVVNVPNKEYVEFINDVVRMITIQVMIQFLFSINTEGVSFFSVDFFLLLLYIVLGVCVYWLVIKKLVMFK